MRSNRPEAVSRAKAAMSPGSPLGYSPGDMLTDKPLISCGDLARVAKNAAHSKCEAYNRVSMSNPTNHIEIITSVQRRRRWTASEKVRSRGDLHMRKEPICKDF